MALANRSPSNARRSMNCRDHKCRRPSRMWRPNRAITAAMTVGTPAIAPMRLSSMIARIKKEGPKLRSRVSSRNQRTRIFAGDRPTTARRIARFSMSQQSFSAGRQELVEVILCVTATARGHLGEDFQRGSPARLSVARKTGRRFAFAGDEKTRQISVFTRPGLNSAR